MSLKSSSKEIPIYKSVYPSKRLEFALKGKKDFFLNFCDHKEPLVRVSLGKRKLVVVTKIPHVKYILNDNFRNFEKRTNISLAFGDNIFTANGETWLGMRKPLRPLFTKESLINNISDMEVIAKDQIDKMDDGTIDVLLTMSRVQFLINTNVLVGMDLGHVFENIHKDFIFLNKYLTELNYRSLNSPILKSFFYKEKDDEFKKIVSRFDNIVIDAIKKSQNLRPNSALKKMLDLNLHLENEMALVNQIKTLIFAGYDTTSLTLSWILYYLSVMPEKQSLIRNELNSVELNNTEYTDAFISETLRLRPIGWAVTRHAVSDDDILGFKINKDDCLFVSPLIIHHSSQYWNDPYRFDENRFLKNEKIEPFSFLAFGGGPRVCVGRELAYMQIKIILKELLNKFEIENLGIKPEYSLQVTLLFKQPFFVKLKKHRA